MSDSYSSAAFILPSSLAGRVWQHLTAIRIAPPSEKLDTWTHTAQLIAGLTGPDFPEREAADRMWAVAEIDEILRTYDTDILQAKLAEGFSDPISPDKFDSTQEGPRPPAFTDEALALRFAELHAHDLRYVAAWSKWLAWDGKRWRFDDTLRAFDLAREVCRKAAAECNTPRIAAVLASAKTVAAVERLAKADRRLAATVGQWDADPRLLNTPAGVIDLRTGKSRPHRPDYYMTKSCAVAPDVSLSISTWLKFLDRVTGGDADLIAFLQRMAGYCLTGLTSEHALFFIYGTGANGKSTFINTLTDVAGDYHRTAPIETFVASSVERHPTDLAGLHGARLVTSVETEEGRRWAESKIKTLTGGDKIAARFMRQDFFEFTPQFKLVIAGNHKPGLRSVDEAIRRRLNLIPFTVTIPSAERDPDLAQKLRAEWPGILAWTIEGCLAWQRDGLAAPAAVTSATAAYLEAEDAMGAWMNERCEQERAAIERSSSLFASWKDWAEGAGETVGSQKNLSQKLEARGFSKNHDRRGSWFAGLRVLVGDS
jgi:putative DNA primase/helicase